ncbi:hypothetical protein ACPOLB_20545 [Rubrivivax sp. RP6-9]|uniref:hypothetical protein n=1 Tax=Rubrivivax sp. RP6-9 TaxID=3415750 RepID=UPI003CC5662A
MDPRFRVAKSPAPPAPPAPTPVRMASINTLLSIAQTTVIAIVGFVLTGRIDQAIKERQTVVQERKATVESVNQMATLLTKVNNPQLPEIERSHATAQLSMYGSDAVFPLFVMAASRSPTPPTEAINGLRLLAVQRRSEVCAVLLASRNVPKALNEIRRGAIADLTTELRCDPAASVPP